MALGTPYFTARDVPCEMCDDIPCVKACPTGALDHALTDIDAARMGLAVVVDQEACIAFQGLRCEVCFNVCPIRGKAITLDYQHNSRSGKHALFIPVVHSNACTGCGKCEKACILEEAAIKVFPVALAKGLLGRHYRLGWEQKAEAGEALKLQFNAMAKIAEGAKDTGDAYSKMLAAAVGAGAAGGVAKIRVGSSPAESCTTCGLKAKS